ncbi:MAG: hypothetical protein L6R39_007036, partial [Caloplaca ligustica]
ILAVLGESNIKIHAQAITASRLCLLPRLLPAPQALLRESRPKRLPYVEEVTVYGTRSGSKRDGLNFIPNLIHRIESAPPYSVQVLEIGWNFGYEQMPVTYRTLAPLNILAIASCLLSVGLMVWAGLVRDGVAFIGIVLISFASSALGYASYWLRELPRKRPAHAPTDEIILRTRWGAFVLVHCQEDVARALYWQTEECNYASSSRVARLLGGVVGGLMVLVAVVLFANCSSWAMQAAIGTSYAVLNVAYWLVTVIPEAWSWDLRCYNVRGREEFRRYGTFTEAIASAIRITGSTAWVRDNQILPRSAAWREWLDRAEDQLDNDDWDPQAALAELLSRTHPNLQPYSNLTRV